MIFVFSDPDGCIADKQYNKHYAYRCAYDKYKAGSSASRHTVYSPGFSLPVNFPPGKMGLETDAGCLWTVNGFCSGGGAVFFNIPKL